MQNVHDQTILITKFKVKKESLISFSDWREKLNHDVAFFPGFVSFEMQHSEQDDYVEWVTIHRFRSSGDMQNWLKSSEKRKLMEDVKPFLLEDGIQESETTGEKSGECVTEVFVTEVVPGRQDSYRAWASKIQEIEAQFEGYRGVYIQAPPTNQGNHWITILRFDTPEHLEKWLNSEERKRILHESEQFVKTLQSHYVVTPFASWFGDLTKKGGEVPAAWKQSMIVLLVLFPIVMLEIKFLNPALTFLNTSLATFIGLAISVSLVSWPLVPLAIKCLKWWLNPGKIHRQQKNIGGTLLVLGLFLLEILLFWNLISTKGEY